MATSSSVQQARQEIADRLREIRLDAGLTKRAVAAAARWHESKCSRIEHARTPPSDEDIRAWHRELAARDVFGAPGDAGGTHREYILYIIGRSDLTATVCLDKTWAFRPSRKGSPVLTTEADIQTEHAAGYLARLCGHAGKMGAAGHRLGHRPRSHSGGGVPPEVRHVECSQTEGTVSLNWGQWTMRASPGLLAIRAEAADEESLRRIQDLLTARLQKFGRREHLTVTWRRPDPDDPGQA